MLLLKKLVVSVLPPAYSPGRLVICPKLSYSMPYAPSAAVSRFDAVLSYCVQGFPSSRQLPHDRRATKKSPARFSASRKRTGECDDVKSRNRLGVFQPDDSCARFCLRSQ
jgi:hypothetical protein